MPTKEDSIRARYHQLVGRTLIDLRLTYQAAKAARITYPRRQLIIEIGKAMKEELALLEREKDG